MLCDKCVAGDPYKVKKNKVPIKKIDTRRILALDAATNVSGYSIINYFTMMKINEAKRLIREGKYNFFEISEMLMFSNSHYFSSVFKKYTGMTPTQYKKACVNL